MTLSILAIQYEEPSFENTIGCINETGIDVVYQHRGPKGIGSLAAAINEGIQRVHSTYCFIATNITFAEDVPERLMFQLDLLKEFNCAAIHPAFNSDHPFCRPSKSGINLFVPFIEFTAAMVNTSVLQEHPLDEEMPYWGHDMDWGYRMREMGNNVAVCQFIEIGHQYIRHKSEYNYYTEMRKEFRIATDYQTERALIKKYGHDFGRLLKTPIK